MCKFFSGIAFKNGDIHYNSMTDSHEDLILELGLEDSSDTKLRRWVRFEYTADDLSVLDDYKLKVDELSVPSWCNSEWKDAVSSRAKNIVSRMILSGVEKKILVGGCWVLTGGSNIDKVVNVRILLMKSSNVGEMRENSKVGVMRGNSKVGEMRENSKVGVMRGNSKVGVMRESSNVGEMRENSKVGVMWENSNVGEMRENSKVGVMWENSNVGEMWENSKVGVMRESSNVGEMRENSKVNRDERIKK